MLYWAIQDTSPVRWLCTRWRDHLYFETLVRTIGVTDLENSWHQSRPENTRAQVLPPTLARWRHRFLRIDPGGGLAIASVPR